MSLTETEGLILKTYNLAEADKIVVLLTRDHGVVRGVAKGAKRLKSKFGSGLEPFSLINVSYLQKENIELVAIDKAEIIRSSFLAASEPEFLQKFSFLGDLVIAFMPPHDPNETLFRMVRSCIDAAGGAGDLSAIGVYFQVWLLKLSGYMPDWRHCENCGRPLDEGEEAALLSNFHLSCRACKPSGGSAVSVGARDVMRAALSISPETFAMDGAEKNEAVMEMSSILQRLISQSLGREIAAERPFSLTIK